MSTVLHTGPEVDDLFKAKVRERGLPEDRVPTAVAMAVNAMTHLLTPYIKLVGELPSSARGFEWLELLFAAFAEWSSHTVVSEEESD